MARALSATDDEILDAGNTVIARRGFDGFTVSEVAREVGLSRAAITLRFKSADHLKSVVLERQAAAWENLLEQLDGHFGEEGLLEIAGLIGSLAGDRLHFSMFMRDFTANIGDGVRLQMEKRRGRALHHAIARVMPPTNVAPHIAADAFMAYISGSLFAWQTSGIPDAKLFLQERARQWMQMVGITSPDSVPDSGPDFGAFDE